MAAHWRGPEEAKVPDDPPDLDQQLQQLFCEVQRREAFWRFADRLDTALHRPHPNGRPQRMPRYQP